MFGQMCFFSLFSPSCILNTMCTVTASTVIGFTGHAHSVPDRCGYTLMTSSSIPGLQVLAVFQERRRRDVSFLDRVILQLQEGRVQISLEQGSRVYVSCKSKPTSVHVGPMYFLCTRRLVLTNESKKLVIV